jgi:hypothetical protein
MTLSDDQRVARWKSLLDLGVVLRIPETSIPYCETDQSTLHSLGFETYVRCDRWHAFEAGHGQYGSTERTELDLAALDRALRALAALPVDPVSVWSWMLAPQEHVPAIETLDRVRSQEICLDDWYPGVEEGVGNVVVGDGADVFWVRRRGATLTRVERLDPAAISLLEALPIALSAVCVVTDEHRALAVRAREHLARHAAMLDELAADPAHYVGEPEAKSGVCLGRSTPWISFWDHAHDRRASVVECSLYQRSWAVAHALFANPSTRVRTFTSAQRAQIDRSEAEVRALYDKLLSGALAYQRNTSVPTLWAWIDGVARGVTVDLYSLRPTALDPAESPALPHMDCAAFVAVGLNNEKFHELDDSWRDAVRALVLASAS